MKNLLHLALMLVASTVLANSNVNKVDFIQGSLSLAVQKAGHEGKLLFVEFGAKWCMPCRFMEENTFQDKEVVQYMSANYVPVKIDIDDFDGFAYKQKYHVEALPTFLILNSEGKVLERYEQSMAPSNLLNILRQHNTSINKQIVSTELSAFEIEAQLHQEQKAKYNVSPYAATPIEEQEIVEDVPVEVSGPVAEQNTMGDSEITSDLTVNNSNLEDIEADEISDSGPTIKDMLVIESSEELLWEDEAEESQNEELEMILLEEESVAQTIELEEETNEILLEDFRPKMVFYTVKIGSFANEESKNDFIRVTSSVFVEDTHIFEHHRAGLISYDVCLGAFSSESTANKFIDKLGLLNISGEIKKIEQ